LSFSSKSCLLSKNVKIKIRACNTEISSFAFHGRGTWSLRVREKKNKDVFGNRVLMRVFRTKKRDITGCWRKAYSLMGSVIICTLTM
jgi:hypothetical protein